MRFEERYVTFEETLKDTNDVGLTTWMNRLSHSARPVKLKEVVMTALQRCKETEKATHFFDPKLSPAITELDKLVSKNFKRLLHATYDSMMRDTFEEGSQYASPKFIYINRRHKDYEELLSAAHLSRAGAALDILQKIGLGTEYAGFDLVETRSVGLEALVAFAAYEEKNEVISNDYIGHAFKHAEFKTSVIEKNFLALLEKYCSPRQSQRFLLLLFAGEIPTNFSLDRRESHSYDIKYDAMAIFIRKVIEGCPYSVGAFLLAKGGLVNAIENFDASQAKALLQYAKELKK